jgi:hypothetical protein
MNCDVQTKKQENVETKGKYGKKRGTMEKGENGKEKEEDEEEGNGEFCKDEDLDWTWWTHRRAYRLFDDLGKKIEGRVRW